MNEQLSENRKDPVSEQRTKKPISQAEKEKRLSVIIDALKKESVDINRKQAEQLYLYFEMLVEKNKVMNLTAITEFEDVVIKHFADSCYLAENYLEKKGKEASLIDVGTGAGFPGLPLKIVFPSLQVTLLDSLNKRVSFLQEVIDRLGLTGIRAVHFRAEDGARDPGLREQFDFAVSRAVANLSTLSEYCLPYVKKGGYFAALKSGEIEAELENAGNAISVLGGKQEQLLKGTIPDTDIQRSIVLIRKARETAKKYPRKAGMPSKQPL